MNIAALFNAPIKFDACEMCKKFRCISYADDTNTDTENALLALSTIQHFLNAYSLTPIHQRRKTQPELAPLLAAMHASYLIVSCEAYKETHKNHPYKIESTSKTPITDIFQKYKKLIEKDFQQNIRPIEHGKMVEISYQLLSDDYQLDVVQHIIDNLKFLGVVVEDESMFMASPHALYKIKKIISNMDRPDTMLCYPIIKIYVYVLEKIQNFIKEIGILIICAVLMYTTRSTLHSTLDNWERIRPKGMEQRHKLAQELTEQLKTLFPPIYYDTNSQGKAAPAPQIAHLITLNRV